MVLCHLSSYYLRKLDCYNLLALDDLGYVKKSEAETSVLLELIAHRFQFYPFQRSIEISSIISILLGSCQIETRA